MLKNFTSAVLCIVTLGYFAVFAIDNNYKTTLYSLCDALLATQITNQADANFGALVCPSTNPDNHPIHSRAAEAVYPFAVAYKNTNQTKYRDAAIRLGNWLVKIQGVSAPAGAWSEDWPTTGWNGTTADQLISLAGAYAIVKPLLSASENTNWNNSIVSAANYVESTFPLGNVNYNAVGGAALRYSYGVVTNPPASWLTKADALINTNTLPNINSDTLLTGEGQGVDLGYNSAQSIGYIALYAILTNDNAVKQRAADMLHAHYNFVYPNGSVDNSWGTRSYKFGYESGTKTAPGVQFSFALLADMDPKFNTAGLKCLEYLRTKAINSGGWITYGPHAKYHTSSTPPCNYQTFARAQNLALSIEYGPDVTATAPFPAQTQNWFKYFPTIKVAVVRTQKIMGTVSAYGAIGQYGYLNVPRGGSLTNFWYEGFGDNGFFQSSSVNSYARTEPRHMPIEGTLLPLTPRVESTIGGTYYANLYETGGTMTVVQETDNVRVTTTGSLCSATGTGSGVNFTIINRFYNDYVKKEITVSGSAQAFRIIEPIVNDSGTLFTMTNSSTVAIKPLSSAGTWNLNVVSTTGPAYTLSMGTNSIQYWSPFPGVECYPIIINFSTASAAAQTIALTITGPFTSVKNPGGSSLLSSEEKTIVFRNHPNPFGHATSIGYTVKKNGRVALEIYTSAGRMVKSLIDKTMPAGTYSVLWDGTDTDGSAVSAGIYICRFSSGSGCVAEKMSVR